MPPKKADRLQQELKELLAENRQLEIDRVRLRDRIDELESDCEISGEELQHLRGIAAASLTLRDFLVNRDYQTTVVRFSRTLANAQAENLL